MKDINELLSLRESSDYQRDDFDAFLNKEKFSFNLPSIHIAGTNGKGSTANYINNIYQKAGYKVGLFTSPYFYEINEMIKINNEPISDERIKKYISEHKKLMEKYDLSSFEVMTYIALEYFKDEKCDVSVIECGMGGEIDATNIFDASLAIITSISLEHTAFLGRTISEIALNKIGIVHEETPVLIDEFDEESNNVIAEYCHDKKSKINLIGKTNAIVHHDDGITFEYGIYKDLKISSFAEYSVKDACYAIEAVNLLNKLLPISEENIKDGLLTSYNELRFEVISRHPLLILDGGHNPEALDKLKKSLMKFTDFKTVHTLFACFRDKNLPAMLNTLGEISATLNLTTFDHPRARQMEDYFLFGDEYEFKSDAVEAVNELLAQYPDDIILVTGSLAFVSFIKSQIKEGKIHVPSEA